MCSDSLRRSPQRITRGAKSGSRPERLVKLGIRLSPRTVRRYLPTSRTPRAGMPSQRWSTFVRNHASVVLACDFFIAITATFRVFYVFVVMEVGTRRIRHCNVTEHPAAEWTAQQFRMAISGDEPHRFLIHDQASLFSYRRSCAPACDRAARPARGESPRGRKHLRGESAHEEGRRREDGVTVTRHPMRINTLSSRTPDADQLSAQIDVGRNYLLNSLAALARRPT